MPIYPNFYQTLSACPIVELRGYAAACGLKGRLYAYLDFAGPTGTARDGLAEGMLALAIEKKKLISGQPIIEAASGPFAAALTLAGLTAGHPVVLVMPAAGCADPPQPGPQRCERCPPSGGTDRRRQRLVLHGLACQR